MSAEPGCDRPLLMCGDKVALAMMLAGDVPAIARWHQDLEFTANMGSAGDVQTIEQRRELFDRNAGMRPGSVEFAVIEIVTGRLVGFGGLFDITRAMTANLFVGIGEADCRQRGYGTEATRLLCEYGFFFRSLHNIKVEVNGHNDQAIRMYQRIGFKPVGRLRGVILLNGRRYDQMIMDVVRDEFPLRYVGSFRSLETDAGEGA